MVGVPEAEAWNEAARQLRLCFLAACRGRPDPPSRLNRLPRPPAGPDFSVRRGREVPDRDGGLMPGQPPAASDSAARPSPAARSPAASEISKVINAFAQRRALILYTDMHPCRMPITARGGHILAS